MNPKQLITQTDFSQPFDLIQDTIDFVVSKAKGFEYQVTAYLLQEGTSRFANNQITQHTDIQNLNILLKLCKGKRIATSSTTTLSKDSLQAFVKNTINSLESSPDITFYQGLPDPVKGQQIDGSGYEWSPEERVKVISESISTGKQLNVDVKLAGTASEQKNYKRIVNSNGIDIEDSYQVNYFKINAISGQPDKRGYGQEGEYWRSVQPDYTVMVEEAVKTSLQTIKFIDLPAPKDYEVVLAESAVSNIMDFILFSLNPVDYHEGNSFASDRIGEQVFDKKISVSNLPLDPSKATIIGAFDNEGIATQNRTIIDTGVLKHIPYNSFFASKYLQDRNLSTGEELAPLNFFSSYPVPISAVVKTGSKSLEDQISEVSDGLLVKTFWYNRYTIKKEGGLTGLTRNGLFHIKDGEIKEAVRNLRYTESFVKAFGPDNVISIGNKCKADEEVISVPSFHLNDYRFSSVAHTFD